MNGFVDLCVVRAFSSFYHNEMFFHLSRTSFNTARRSLICSSLYIKCRCNFCVIINSGPALHVWRHGMYWKLMDIVGIRGECFVESNPDGLWLCSSKRSLVWVVWGCIDRNFVRVHTIRFQRQQSDNSHLLSHDQAFQREHSEITNLKSLCRPIGVQFISHY